MGLIHCPITFDDIAGRCALAFAGHTHGGQVRIPGLPPLWPPAGCGRYVAGWYERNGSRLYVSRGIGAKTLPIRLWLPPGAGALHAGRGVRRMWRRGAMRPARSTRQLKQPGRALWRWR